METSKGTAQPQSPASPRAIQFGRWLFLLTGVAMAALSVAGFQEFYLHGREAGGMPISPPMRPYVIVHGLALTAWIVLFVVQAALIASRRRRLHRTLGWAGAALAGVIVGSGLLMVVRSVQAGPLGAFVGMEYRQFLLVMFVELGTFAAFAVTGVLLRRRPDAHRAMMLLATLSVLSGATIRIPALATVFGTAGWVAMFGPVVAFGGIVLAARILLQRFVDRWFAAGLASMSLVFLVAMHAATTAWWHEVAHRTFGL